MKRGLLALLMVLMVCALPGTSYAETTGEENLGQPIANRILSQEQSQGVDADGRPQAYWVTAGNSYMNAMFQATDIRSGEVVFKQRVPDGGTDSWANTFSAADGTVYFAMTSGQTYRWKPGDAAITSLGTPFPGEGVWRLAAAPDGVIYGGTYPGGLLFSYDPGTGEFTDHGQIVPGETYGRALAVDDTSVYFGTQPRARLARFDRASGQVEQIPLPAEYATSEVVYDMTRARDLLLLRVQPSNDLLFYDTAGKRFVNVVKGISARAVSTPDPTGRYVYFRIAAEGVVQYDLDTHTYTPVGWGPNAFPGAWAWIELDDPDFPGRSLSMTYYYGRIYIWNPETKKTRYLGESGLEGSANPIQAIGAGPGGEVYAGGFLSPPGISRFDPATGAYTLLSSGGQVEGFGRYGDHVVYGRYPNGELLDYDPARPWAYGTNPAPVTIGEEQDRPQAFVQVGDRVAVGSVPKSGRLGGALTLWDPRTRTVEVHRGVVPDQSVVSLATRDGLVYGGTSVHGGYGIDPVATSARLFVFDPATGAVVSSVVPVEGAHSVNALTVDAKGRIWGLADGHLFVYLPEAKRVTRVAALFPRQSSRYGADRALVFRGDDLYAAMAGSLWRIDPRTWKATALAGDGVSQLVTGGDGHLYYFRGTELFRRHL